MSRAADRDGDERAVALAEILARVVTGAERPGDEQAARAMLAGLADAEGNELFVLAATFGAVTAAWPPREPPADEVIAASAAAARALAVIAEPAHRAVLGAAALALMAAAGLSDQPAADLLRAAHVARGIDQHALSAIVAHALLASGLPLTDSQQASALLLIAVTERDQAAVEELATLLPRLSSQDPARRQAEALWPTLGSADLGLGDAVARNDRVETARRLAGVFDELAAEHPGDELLGGLAEAAHALTVDDIDAAAARRGLERVLRHWRRRRRAGEDPAVARAGIDTLLDLLVMAEAPARADLLCELLEASADSGLGATRGPLAALEPAAIVNARVSGRAASDVRWPDLARITDRLGDTHVLLLHAREQRARPGIRIIGVHLRPPRGVALKGAVLDGEPLATTRRLLNGSAAAIATLRQSAIDELVAGLLPATLARALAAGSVRSLLIVPDGPLWAIPWPAAGPLTAGPSPPQIAVCPSMTVWSALHAPTAAVRSVLAVIDETVPGGEIVAAALEALHREGSAITRVADVASLVAAGRHDLLVIFGHGAGVGLDFGVEMPSGAISVLELAAAAPAAQALIASCWSGSPPPSGFPLSVPAALLLAGIDAVVAGLWPLPAVATGELVAATLRGIAVGHDLAAAHSAATRAAAHRPLVERGGLVLFGRAV